MAVTTAVRNTMNKAAVEKVDGEGAMANVLPGKENQDGISTVNWNGDQSTPFTPGLVCLSFNVCSNVKRRSIHSSFPLTNKLSLFLSIFFFLPSSSSLYIVTPSSRAQRHQGPSLTHHTTYPNFIKRSKPKPKTKVVPIIL
ncbi:hypothetical protein RIF29_40128 [Crotalaria pallida]|uniref:Uncharacterized protein n=1 Tax=Crotalaria pallida TaxID=3830 RepID=A0AAN9E2Y6_CROPI